MHFTYCDKADFESLKQGDVLERTPELDATLKEYHSYFSNSQYTHFLVLTQTCDLDRRGGASCKSRYITLAAVRSLSDVINRFLMGITTKIDFDGDLYCSASKKGDLSGFLKKLFNNNDTSHFYLESQPSAGLIEDSCAVLQLSIPIKSDEHYEKCLAAKRLELEEGFKAKLGWLVGNLYSRVGTVDYVPGAVADEASFNRKIEDELNSHVHWVPSQKFESFKRHAKTLGSIKEIEAKIETEATQQRLQKVSNLIKVIKNVVDLDDTQEGELRNVLGQYTLS